MGIGQERYQVTIPYRLELETRARKEFLDLPKEAARMLAAVLDDLCRNPRPPGSKKLLGIEGYRVRKGDYRVLYAVEDSRKIISVYRIGHRREVYRRK
ncbi:MAG: type II toxin-antitoxin system RelE/ParE family toxin [Elusimicrobia bacterium]|nr:type II toxin-antitoxin system RelE/ParE family toxin [Elusimicrobiota bacterium]